MKMTFLGTGAGVPSKERNVSSLVLHTENRQNSLWLFDCGEGTQQQFLNSSPKAGKVDRIFITHLHGDHLYGLPGFLASRSFQGAERPLTIYGPAGIEAYVRTSLEISGTHLLYDCRFEEIRKSGRLFESDGYTVVTDQLDHGIPSFGYRIEAPSKPGPLLKERVQAEGIEPGPWLGELKQGKRVTLPDGRKVCGHDYIGSPIKGKTAVILGDTRKCKAAEVLSREADVVVHEATFSGEEEKRAYDFYHSTTIHAAQTARDARAKKLILTHISPRYTNPEPLLKEAVSVFAYTVIAKDFMTMIV
ncbi:ribonuclease Z [Alteribacter lacisalsi]|uniref:Ribonuclease Z n=1 Tax=Alteribacter lacisalsi TaxID=2045244 RepID=A0A2W0H8M7_9BACI|nr:ribonuclease Z [Alteribacter lacisalsi]PYZ98223.1 ribonuclease Z [Alteribacter lacisalsi]